MQDNFNIHNWRLKQAIKELEEKTLCKECGSGYMEEGQCNECGYLKEDKFYSRDYVAKKYGNKAKEIEANIEDEEDNNPNIWDLYTSLETPEETDDFVQGYIDEAATFTDKHDDHPKLKGGQKDLPDELQAQLIKKEGSEEDHEVFMAKRSLQAIMSACSKLMVMLGDKERNIPGWIQDHIVNAENYIEQAAQGFHELDSDDTVTDTEDSDVVTELERVDDDMKTKARSALMVHLKSAREEGDGAAEKEVLQARQEIMDATSVDELTNILGEFGFEDDEIQDILGL